jgi:hypothetical protein
MVLPPSLSRSVSSLFLFILSWELNNITEAIVAVSGFDHGKVTDCFNQIVVLLNVAIADLKVTVAAKLALDALLTINGLACTIADLAGVVYALLLVRICANRC